MTVELNIPVKNEGIATAEVSIEYCITAPISTLLYSVMKFLNVYQYLIQFLRNARAYRQQ